MTARNGKGDPEAAAARVAPAGAGSIPPAVAARLAQRSAAFVAATNGRGRPMTYGTGTLLEKYADKPPRRKGTRRG